MATPTRPILRLAVLIAGIPILILGVILLVLPGPGLLVSLLGLFILSWQFDWAKKPLEKLKGKLRKPDQDFDN